MVASVWLRDFCVAQDIFDLEGRAWFDGNEAEKERNLAPKVGDTYLILDEIGRHFQSNPEPAVRPASNPEPAVCPTNNPASAVHPTSNQESPSTGTIFIIRDFKSAWGDASVANDWPESAQRLVLWTDTSQAGYWGTNSTNAVALKGNGEWRTITTETVGQPHMTDIAELYAIGHALEFAVNEVQKAQTQEKLLQVMVFTDSQCALRRIARAQLPERDP
ncbi:Fc.00g088770.m01.CDS01 [Cosmosporella sp. VM-42]